MKKTFAIHITHPASFIQGWLPALGCMLSCWLRGLRGLVGMFALAALAGLDLVGLVGLVASGLMPLGFPWRP